MEPYVLDLPFPPSLNVYYENRRAKVKRGPSAGKIYNAKMISAEGQAFRGEVNRIVRLGHRSPPKLSGRLSVVVFACPPAEKKDGSVNNNIRDLDNLWKCLLDAMKKAEVIMDDSLFDFEAMLRGNPHPQGRVWVSISRFDPDAAFGMVRAAGIEAVGFSDLLAALERS